MEGAKYPGESWVACLIYLSDPFPSICVGLNAKLAVVLLQMHCQTKLRRSPCSVFPFFKTWGRNFFLSWTNFFSCGHLDLVLDCNGFEGLHQYRFSFICRNPSVWDIFDLQVVISLYQVWYGLFLSSWTDIGSWGSFWFFFASYSLGYLWKQNLPLERVRFFPDDCQLRSRQHRHFCPRMIVDLLFTKL